MSKNSKTLLKEIHAFRGFLRAMLTSMQVKADIEKPGELKELYKMTAFTYEQVIEEMNRHFHLVPPY